MDILGLGRMFSPRHRIADDHTALQELAPDQVAIALSRLKLGHIAAAVPISGADLCEVEEVDDLEEYANDKLQRKRLFKQIREWQTDGVPNKLFEATDAAKPVSRMPSFKKTVSFGRGTKAGAPKASEPTLEPAAASETHRTVPPRDRAPDDERMSSGPTDREKAGTTAAATTTTTSTPAGIPTPAAVAPTAAESIDRPQRPGVSQRTQTAVETETAASAGSVAAPSIDYSDYQMEYDQALDEKSCNPIKKLVDDPEGRDAAKLEKSLCDFGKWLRRASGMANGLTAQQKGSVYFLLQDTLVPLMWDAHSSKGGGAPLAAQRHP